MSEEKSPALRVALAYYQAWTSKNVDEAMSYIAPEIVCDAPAGPIHGSEAYRAFIGPFAKTLIGATLIATFGDDERAVVMYDTETVLVKSAPAAECVTVRDGRIVYSRFIFDRLPFEEARRAAA